MGWRWRTGPGPGTGTGTGGLGAGPGGSSRPGRCWGRRGPLGSLPVPPGARREPPPRAAEGPARPAGAAQFSSSVHQWLDLHLKENVPPSLLLLSRTLYLIDLKPQPVPENKVGEAKEVMTSVHEHQETLVDPAPAVQGRKNEEFISQPTEKLPVSEVPVKPPPRETKLEASQSSKAGASGV